MKILIITGGSSSERKISLLSAKAVKTVLENNGHQVVSFDFKKGYPELKKIFPNFDVVFPVMHGKEGSDGTLYKFLSSTKKPYVGASFRGAKITANKILFKKYCDKNNYPTADWKIVKNNKDLTKFGFPCVLKAAEGGCSHEVSILHSEKDLAKSSVNNILTLPTCLFVEGFIKGIEVTASVLAGKALPLIEIIPPGSGWFDYKNKYSGKTKEIPFAPSVSKKMQKEVQRLAVQIHNDLNLGSYSRTDFIINNGTAYVLETNNASSVGLTSQSLFPKAAQAKGMDFANLLEKILKKLNR